MWTVSGCFKSKTYSREGFKDNMKMLGILKKRWIIMFGKMTVVIKKLLDEFRSSQT